MSDSGGLQPGDKVRLKSGGPLMTVEKVETIANGDAIVRVAWFVKGQPKRDHYPPDALETDGGAGFA